MLCGDLGSNRGGAGALTSNDIVEEAIEGERMFPNAAALAPTTPGIIRRLAGLAPTTLAIMHGTSFTGDTADLLDRLADSYVALTSEVAAAAT